MLKRIFSYNPFHDRMAVFNKIKPYIKSYETYFISMFLCRIVLIMLGLAGPYFYKVLVDDVILGKKISALYIVCFGYLLIFILQALTEAFQLKKSNKFSIKMTYEIRLFLWRLYSYMANHESERYSTGEIKNTINDDVEKCETIFTKQMVEFLFSIISAVVYGIVMLYLNWKLGLFGLITIPISFIITRWLGKKLREYEESYRKIYGNYENWLHNSMQSWKEVKALPAMKHQERIFADFWHRMSIIFFTKFMYWTGNVGLVSFKNFIVTNMSLYFLGGLLIIRGELTVGWLLVFMQYYSSFLANIDNLVTLEIDFKTINPAIDRVLKLFDIKPYYKIGEQLPKESYKKNIKLNNVSFYYPSSDKKALDNININIRYGENIAIVGVSGSGKTTLLKLFTRHYIPSKGGIFIDDSDIQDINLKNYHSNIGIVMQDSVLFNLSIRDNLLIAKSDASEQELIEACKSAYIYDFIEALPDKYNTIIGEKGVKLSGGQRQRIVLARLFLQNPEIVFLDEATSSLDHEAEKNINNTVKLLGQDRTIISVAHRYSTALMSPRVIVLHEGKIVGDGTHEELSQNNPYYISLFGDMKQESM